MSIEYTTAAKLQIEIDRLTAENEQLMEQIATRQPSVVERDMQLMMQSNNRLRAALEAAKRYLVGGNLLGFSQIPRSRHWLCSDTNSTDVLLKQIDAALANEQKPIGLKGRLWRCRRCGLLGGPDDPVRNEQKP